MGKYLCRTRYFYMSLIFKIWISKFVRIQECNLLCKLNTRKKKSIFNVHLLANHASAISTLIISFLFRKLQKMLWIIALLFVFSASSVISNKYLLTLWTILNFVRFPGIFMKSSELQLISPASTFFFFFYVSLNVANVPTRSR